MKALRQWWRAEYHRCEQGLTADATVGRPGASFIRFLQGGTKKRESKKVKCKKVRPCYLIRRREILARFT